jgi:hypothetical protein
VVNPMINHPQNGRFMNGFTTVDVELPNQDQIAGPFFFAAAVHR